MSSSGFYQLIRIIIHDDPDVLTACLMRLRMEGHTDWRMGTFLGQQNVYRKVLASGPTKMGESARFIHDIWPLIRDFNVRTLGRQSADYFAEEK